MTTGRRPRRWRRTASAWALFLVFTVRARCGCSGWSTSSTTAARTRAALAVAEERLRFSRDVHDVLGRRLSDDRRAGRARRAPCRPRRRARRRAASSRCATPPTTALREARELARGYRPARPRRTSSTAPGLLLRSAGHRVERRPRRPARAVARARRAGHPRGRHQRAAPLPRHPRDITYDDAGRGSATTGPRPPSGTGGHRARRSGRAPRRPRRPAGDRPATGDAVRVTRPRSPCPSGRRARMIRVLLADDEHLIRSALAQMLDLEDDLEVVAQAGDRRRGARPRPRGRARRGGARPAAARRSTASPSPSGWPSAVPGCRAPDRDQPRPAGPPQAGAGQRGQRLPARRRPRPPPSPRWCAPCTPAAATSTPSSPPRPSRPATRPLTPREADVLDAAADGAPVDEIARRATSRPGRSATTCPAPPPSWAPPTATRRPPSPGGWAGSDASGLAGEPAGAPAAGAAEVGPADAAVRRRPLRRTTPRRLAAGRPEGGEHGHQGRDLLGGGVGVDDAQQRGCRAVVVAWLAALAGLSLSLTGGMFPCFLGGRVSRLERSSRSDADDLGAGLVRGDDRVDVAALGGDVGVGEGVVVLLDELGAALLDVAGLARRPRSPCGRGC